LVAALSLLSVTLGCVAIMAIFASYAPTARDLLTVPLTIAAFLLGSCIVSVGSAGLLFSRLRLGKAHRLCMFVSVLAIAGVNFACGYIMFLFWLAPLLPLWRFYREATA
jgi:hypothetical protein